MRFFAEPCTVEQSVRYMEVNAFDVEPARLTYERHGGDCGC